MPTLCGQNHTKERKEEERRGEETAPAAAWREGIAQEAGLNPSTIPLSPNLNETLEGIDPEAIRFFFQHWRHYWFATKRTDRDLPVEKRLPDFNPKLFAQNIQAVVVDMAIAKQNRPVPWKSESDPVTDEEREQLAEAARKLAEKMSGGSRG